MSETSILGPREDSIVSVTTATLAALLNISPDALVVVSQAGSIVQMNAQATALFGYHAEELKGQPLEVLLPERFRKGHVAHREHYTAAPHTRPMGAGLELFGRRKDGTEFAIDVSLRPVRVEGVMQVIAAVRDITLLRRVEQERTRQAEQLRVQSDLLALAHDAILVRDPQSRIVFWNRGAEEFYGWTAREAEGHVTHTLLKTRFPLSLAAVDEQMTRYGSWEGELVHTRRDGSSVLVESRQVLVRNEQGQPTAILEINRDITERRRLEQIQQATHAATAAHLTFLQQVLDTLPSSVYLVRGPQARLVLANQATASIWGAPWRVNQPMQEFLVAQGIEIFDIQGRPLLPQNLATTRAVRHGETVLQHQETIRRPSGSSLPVLVNAVPLSGAHLLSLLGQESGSQAKEPESLALVVHQDVTALKEAEYLKDEFIGIAAHELRTPMAVLKGSIETLLLQTARGHGPPLAEWQQEILWDLEQATNRLIDLSDDLLDVTRLQAGRLLLQRTPTNIVSLVQRVVARLQQTTSRHQLEVHTSQSVLEAEIDPGRIEQVLMNLIGNAIKYSPQGGIVLITIWQEAATACISVQDSGIGIPEYQQVLIFGRFMRADNAQAAGITGTGLGLYLCRELVERHGGHLWFQSSEGVGSTFFLTLPCIESGQNGAT
ncbi:MAG TPA: PAS domain-containing sensor histidine kinase [Ktedonobacteraceae bacterium]|nr:PAS domain-containing sensor histidine kinase [Ktedonobacteraceae bacterium]